MSVAVVADDDDGAADSNGASSGDGEDVAPTAPDCESIARLLSLSVCISVCVCVCVSLSFPTDPKP